MSRCIRVCDVMLKTKLTSSKDNDVGGVVALCNSAQASGTHAFGP
jgi:hypothetical protein